jgi:uncharacterized UPF0146 family protein
MRSALRQLCRHGVEALRPQKVNDKWRKPVISKRVAADLRKLALRSGTYGSFDVETGLGWDPTWDTPNRRIGGGMMGSSASSTTVAAIDGATTDDNNTTPSDELLVNNDIILPSLAVGSNAGSIQSIRPPKGHKRERTREMRAKKIEDLVAKADERIEEYRLEREKNRPLAGIEEEFKRAEKGSTY